MTDKKIFGELHSKRYLAPEFPVNNQEKFMMTIIFMPKKFVRHNKRIIFKRRNTNVTYALFTLSFGLVLSFKQKYSNY